MARIEETMLSSVNFLFNLFTEGFFFNSIVRETRAASF